MRTNRVIVLDPQAKQAPFIEFDTRTRRWRVWMTFDGSITNGTYLDLYDTGLCERVTLQSGGEVREITRITGPVAS